MKVTVVLDPTFAARNEPLNEPWWIVDSVANRALAEKLRALPGHDPNSAVFRDHEDASREDIAIGIFDMVERHHPDWTEMAFVGATCSPEVTEAMAQKGLSAAPASYGFVLTA